MAALLCVGMLFSNMELYPVESRAAQQKTVTGSNVSYLKYQRDEVLEVAGEPFFYNGVQIRADKVTDVYDFTNEQVEELFRTASEDGFTVAQEEEGFVLYDGEKTAPILMDASYEESGLDTHPERSYTQVTRLSMTCARMLAWSLEPLITGKSNRFLMTMQNSKSIA